MFATIFIILWVIHNFSFSLSHDLKNISIQQPPFQSFLHTKKHEIKARTGHAPRTGHTPRTGHAPSKANTSFINPSKQLQYPSKLS